MSDVTKCKGIGCNLKFGCYRFKAIPNELYQSYFREAPVETKDDGIQTCGYFWATEEFLKIEKDNAKQTND